MMMRKAGMMVLSRALACLLLAGALTLSGPVRAEDCSTAFDQAAKEYYQHKNNSTLDAPTCRALTAKFQAVADQYPDCAKSGQALYLAGLLGKMAYNQAKDKKDLAGAEKALAELVAKHPQSPLLPKAHYHLGEIHLLTGEKDEARQCFQKCAELNDDKMSEKAREQLAKFGPAPTPAPAPAPAPETGPVAPPAAKSDPIRVDDQAGDSSGPAPEAAGPPLPPPASEPPGNDDPQAAPPAAVPGPDGLAEEDLGSASAHPPAKVQAPASTPAPAVAEDPAAKVTIEEIIRGEGPEAPPEPESEPPPPTAPMESAPAEPLISTSPPLAPGDYAQLTAIRYWTNKDYTRVVVEASREVPFTEPVLLPPDPAQGVPPRLYLDLAGAVISKDIADPDTPEAGCFTLPIGDGLLKKARAGQYRPDVARVVLDIERIDRFKAFPLPGETFRFVIDVYGSPAPKAVAKGRDKAKAPGSDKSPGREDRDSLSQWFRSGGPPEPGLGRKYIVVVDAGHGGKDPGARGPSGSREKDIALAIAREVKRTIEREREDVEVVFTRDDDRFIPLVERTAIANTINADLFVSVHINAAKNRDAHGVETYFLDNTTDRAALKLAAKENFVAEEQLLDSADSTNRILADMIQSSKVEDSVPLAHSVQDKLVAALAAGWDGVADKGVKKAPFWVLTGATMPCVLVEVGFISNRSEEKRLVTDDYQDAAAAGIAAGISSYLDSYLQLSRNE